MWTLLTQMQLSPFRGVYDGTSSYNIGHAMPAIPFTEILVGDLVVVETTLRRRVLRARSPRGSRATVPVVDGFWFDLKALSVLSPRVPCAGVHGMSFSAH